MNAYQLQTRMCFVVHTEEIVISWSKGRTRWVQSLVVNCIAQKQNAPQNIVEM